MAEKTVVVAGSRDLDECSASTVLLSLVLGDTIGLSFCRPLSHPAMPERWSNDYDPLALSPTMVLSKDTLAECRLRIEPDRPAIIGRASGHEVPYLDTTLRPSNLVPGTGQNILHSDSAGRDVYVSRAHFMLRAAAGGVYLINGVPDRSGGIRPPRNGTWLLAPMHRAFRPAEEYLVETEVRTIVALPNGSAVRIIAL